MYIVRLLCEVPEARSDFEVRGRVMIALSRHIQALARRTSLERTVLLYPVCTHAPFTCYGFREPTGFLAV